MVPLDDRPCTYRFPEELAKIGGIKLLLPPHAWMGNFNRSGDTSKIAGWVEENFPAVDGAVLSLDMLAYGGLVASRECTLGSEEIFASVNNLIKKLKAGGNAFIWAFGSIMRTLPTTGGGLEHIIPHVKEYYFPKSRKPPKYSKEYIDRYLDLRSEKHATDKRFIDLVAGEHLDCLVCGLDDTGSGNPGSEEAARLREHASGLDITDNLHITCGIDEMAMLLLARAAAMNSGTVPKIAFKYYPEKAADAVPLYEDMKLKEIASAQVKLSGGRVAGEKDADIIIFVHAAMKQKDVPARPNSRIPRKIINDIRDSLLKGKRAALADVRYANGGDLSLLEGLKGAFPFYNLNSYAAWNTTANTLGTVISHSILRMLSPGGKKSEAAHQAFMLERLLDDGIYQGELRRKARARFKNTGSAETWLEKNMRKRAGDIFNEYFKGSNFRLKDLEVSFPWGRFFEIVVNAALAPEGSA